MDTPFDAVVKGNLEFSREFYTVVAEAESGNFVSSPMSCLIALAMAHAGAKGDSIQEIARALHLPENMTHALKGLSEVLTQLRRAKKVELWIANKIYVKQNFPILAEYSKALKKFFKVEAENVVFTDPSTADKMNEWVSKETNNKITNLVDPNFFDDQTHLVLVNAIYFKGPWLKPFKKDSTRNLPFFTDENTSVQVPTMYQSTYFNYRKLDELDAQLLIMHYEGYETSMAIILPNKKDGLKELEEKLATADLDELLQSASPLNVEVHLPKFKIETSLDLVDNLSKMGLSHIFSDTVNLTGISTAGNLKVSQVVQKAFIEVSEEGTEAAAVTAGDMDTPFDAVVKGNSEFSREFYKGDSIQEIARVLHLPENMTHALEGLSEVVKQLKRAEYVELSIANKINVTQDFPILEEYSLDIKKYFQVEAENVVFTDPSTADKINNWVSKQTKDKITSLVQSDFFDAQTCLVLVNAIYFKGSWLDPFKKHSTHIQPFFTDENTSVQVPIMYKETYLFPYKKLDELDAQLLIMPYQGSKMSMAIILPNKKDGLKVLEEKLATADLGELLQSASPLNVEVHLPKFKIETSLDLVDHLAKMGLSHFFSDNVNLTGISTAGNLKVSKVVQKAFIEVSEEGTEASAATGKEMAGEAANLGYFVSKDQTRINADNVCVLVVHYNFENTKDESWIREGDAQDVENLEKTFRVTRNCKFRSILSPEKGKLLKLLSDQKELLQLFGSSDVPSVFVLYILSHGDIDGKIFTDHSQNDDPKDFICFTTTEIFESLKMLTGFEDCLKLINFGVSLY
ncbi:uncharacterized protein LOC135935939 [Cloeon dipterum]|uniref:uncharacterized protein LOC135935939 n=1 Tax=Cloeon dipterum TaxID=197152 RepID=UPI003220502B